MKKIGSKIIYFVAMLFVGLIAKECSKSVTKSFFTSLSKPSYNDSLRMFLNLFPQYQDSINKNIGKVNELIKSNPDALRLDSVSLRQSDTSLSYYYTFQKYAIEDLNLAVAKEIINHNIDSVVNKSDVLDFFKTFQTNIYYSYYDKNGNLIVTVRGNYSKRIIKN